jgi:hypothetical protein
MKTLTTIVLIILVLVGVVYFLYDTSIPRFTADVDGMAFKADGLGGKYTPGRLNLFGMMITPDTTVVSLDVNATKAGTYLLNDDDPQKGNAGVYFRSKTVFASTSKYTGSVTITKFDLENKEFSGAFEFHAVQVYPEGTRVIHVTNGAFKNAPIK